jgi:hypothetical protein
LKRQHLFVIVALAVLLAFGAGSVAVAADTGTDGKAATMKCCKDGKDMKACKKDCKDKSQCKKDCKDKAKCMEACKDKAKCADSCKAAGEKK